MNLLLWDRKAKFIASVYLENNHPLQFLENIYQEKRMKIRLEDDSRSRLDQTTQTIHKKGHHELNENRVTFYNIQ